MKCFYHSVDLDGHCSAAIVMQEFPDCELIGINYGDEFPWDTLEDGEQVWMVDFCLEPFSDMERLADLCCLTWIDHHKSAIEAAAKSAEYDWSALGLQEIGRAGCELVWEYTRGSAVGIPDPVALIGRFDVWDHSDPSTVPFQYGLRTMDMDVENVISRNIYWAAVLGGDMKFMAEVVSAGQSIVAYRKIEQGKHAEACAFVAEFEGVACLIMQASPCWNSLAFDAVDKGECPVLLQFAFMKNGKFTVSLYQSAEWARLGNVPVDVSVMAVANGGGGHAGAAGFTAERCFLPSKDWFARQS